MKCPHCENELLIPDNAVWNMEIYQNGCTVATLCCGKGVSCSPVFTFTVRPYTGTETEDNWGRRFK